MASKTRRLDRPADETPARPALRWSRSPRAASPPVRARAARSIFFGDPPSRLPLRATFSWCAQASLHVPTFRSGSRRANPGDGFDQRSAIAQQELLERERHRWQTLFLAMHDIPVQHERKATHIENGETADAK